MIVYLVHSSGEFIIPLHPTHNQSVYHVTARCWHGCCILEYFMSSFDTVWICIFFSLLIMNLIEISLEICLISVLMEAMTLSVFVFLIDSPGVIFIVKKIR